MKKILFQGDSITDAGRSRENDWDLGVGYPHFVAAEVACEHPNEYDFFNRGISGNRVVDLYARIKSDIINLAPDVMSVLIGVNDVWHDLDGKCNGVAADKYEKIYSMLIEEVKAALPELKIIILEPFVLHGSGTNEKYDLFRKEVEARACASRSIAEKYGCEFVPLQAQLDELYKQAPEGYWLADGVHPTQPGHAFIKREWIKAFNNL